ncbi:acyl-CoA synthetase [Actinophytocola xinjiangensis]|uniref:Acyl-CoA synthetase n=1 Tax=Actinophytocola xinjiangensis TaxID=485602 RepID=A0A7Z0WFL1_9PSEU|nr:acyl-CoA synthetase [Actinophytocola xinjiangensis]OLF06193.1 acyl-CoA synthetase [Actinophytocola xinjiangensis]
MVFAGLADGGGRPALRFPDAELTYGELASLAAGLADALAGCRRVAVFATPTIETCVAVVGALVAGVAVVPINPRSGERELQHIVTDSQPDAVLSVPGEELPGPLGDLRRLPVTLAAAPGTLTPVDRDGETPAFVIYTSGTTGPPKGVVLPLRAVTSNLDALADAWAWTAADVLVHGLPLFHVHGLILGVVGPLRRGGTLRHLGRFDTAALGAALAGDATMAFGVPTMYQRLVADCEADPDLARAVGGARLLVSGSAALPATVHQRLTAATGQRVVERYGMTETLMNTAVRADGDRRPGTVGAPLPGISLRLLDDAGTELSEMDGETVGEIHLRGPNLFLEYLNRPDATAAALREGWFATGDMAVRDPDGYVRIVGRRATDLIKSGGYKIGAGEIENILLEHPAVAEAAVTGEPDEDLGERIVAWIVPTAVRPSPDEIADHVARQLAPHKRPRVVRYLDALPRNDMGKIMKRALTSAPPGQAGTPLRPGA